MAIPKMSWASSCAAPKDTSTASSQASGETAEAKKAKSPAEIAKELTEYGNSLLDTCGELQTEADEQLARKSRLEGAPDQSFDDMVKMARPMSDLYNIKVTPEAVELLGEAKVRGLTEETAKFIKQVYVGNDGQSLRFHEVDIKTHRNPSSLQELKEKVGAVAHAVTNPDEALEKAKEHVADTVKDIKGGAMNKVAQDVTAPIEDNPGFLDLNESDGVLSYNVQYWDRSVVNPMRYLPQQSDYLKNGTGPHAVEDGYPKTADEMDLLFRNGMMYRMEGMQKLWRARHGPLITELKHDFKTLPQDIEKAKTNLVNDAVAFQNGIRSLRESLAASAARPLVLANASAGQLTTEGAKTDGAKGAPVAAKGASTGKTDTAAAQAKELSAQKQQLKALLGDNVSADYGAAGGAKGLLAESYGLIDKADAKQLAAFSEALERHASDPSLSTASTELVERMAVETPVNVTADVSGSGKVFVTNLHVIDVMSDGVLGAKAANRGPSSLSKYVDIGKISSPVTVNWKVKADADVVVATSDVVVVNARDVLQARINAPRSARVFGTAALDRALDETLRKSVAPATAGK